MSKHGTILGHLVGWGLSRRYEDAATEGLAYLLWTFAPLREHFVGLLRAAQPELPTDLNFGTQGATDEGRPDMVGRSGHDVRVFVENKFWAALTENQPNSYIQQLQQEGQAALLLLVVPRARVPWIWRELLARLKAGELAWADATEPRSAGIHEGPLVLGNVRMALTTWDTVLLTLRGAAAADPRALADLEQLAGVCSAADEDATRPLIREELSDPRVPTRLLQYGTIVQEAIARGCKDILKVDGLRPAHSWATTGRYFQFAGENGPGAWLGVELGLWRKYEVGPLWLTFGPGSWGQADRARNVITGWAQQIGRVVHQHSDGGFSVHIELLVGREQDAVVDAVVMQLREFHGMLVVTPTDSAEGGSEARPGSTPISTS